MIIRRGVWVGKDRRGGGTVFLMKPKIISWNARGINDANKRLRICSLLHSWKADIVCIQVTKLSHVDRNIIQSLWGCSFVGWSFLAPLGASGGVLLMWDKRVVHLVEDCIENHSVAVSFKNVVDGWRWALVGVYGPNMDRDRRLLWEGLAGLHHIWELPWIVMASTREGGTSNLKICGSKRSVLGRR
ncbi:exodeoxyribonuclease-like [Juglans microcarpa x Juglans regia]|uniref:exodeoxyribonuclease-like n=1 Tax=Juglans microcarpa x Juglans regia TaxID=2249226 RepID=UPI001B7EDE02|nr:exodeoxyribonuclease-like [Juglans microcarpa x Juglans regia]